MFSTVCDCLIGYGRPGPKGDKGDSGSFVPNSGLITKKWFYAVVCFLRSHNLTNSANTGTFFSGPPGPPGSPGPKGATGELQINKSD